MGWQVRHTSALLAEWQDSYTSSILLSVPLGLAAALALAPTDTAAQARIALLPFALFGVGLLGSLVAFLAIKPRLDSPSNKLSRQLQRADLLSTGVTAVGSLAVCGYLLKGLRLPGAFGWWGLWGCLGVGFLLNIVIGILVDQTRSRAPGNDSLELRAVPHRLLRLGPTLLFALLVGFGAFALGGGFSQMQSGFFGVALVSNGLLLPMATNLSCGLFGILISNAAAKEMVEPGALHLATSRWRSIAASTSVILALLIVYSEALKVRLVQLASEQSSVLVWAKTTIDEVQARAATNQELALWYDAGLLNPLLLAALLLGSTLLFLAPAFTLSTALKLSPTKPQDESASESLTLWLQGSQMRACYLVALALLISLASGMLGGPTAVIGLLLGGLITGLPLLVVLEESTPGRAELSPPLGALLRLLALLSIILSGLVVSLSPLIAGKLGLFP